MFRGKGGYGLGQSAITFVRVMCRRASSNTLVSVASFLTEPCLAALKQHPFGKDESREQQNMFVFLPEQSFFQGYNVLIPLLFSEAQKKMSNKRKNMFNNLDAKVPHASVFPAIHKTYSPRPFPVVRTSCPSANRCTTRSDLPQLISNSDPYLTLSSLIGRLTSVARDANTISAYQPVCTSSGSACRANRQTDFRLC